MLLSQEVRTEIAAEWRTLEDMVELARWSWTEVDVGYGDFKFTRELAVSSLNLCVLFGLSLLERVLLHLRNEGYFRTRGSSLYRLMQASRDAGLPWRDFRCIDDIRRRRNEVAHRRGRFNEKECLAMLLAIADELEEQSIVCVRKQLFMDGMGLSALNVASQRFHLQMFFPPDMDKALQEQIFGLAKELAAEATKPVEFQSRLRDALAMAGLPTDMEYVLEFQLESADDKTREGA